MPGACDHNFLAIVDHGVESLGVVRAGLGVAHGLHSGHLSRARTKNCTSDGPGASSSSTAHERVVLTRHGRPVAAVVSLDDLRALELAEGEADLQAAREALASEERRVPHREILGSLGLV
ncbi:type II toxin-antitoxin system Phd/YefM family antitoxin [Actinophytocola sp.]|uniref:type II toxin-antitoxin system Phd/YefM family antitoxin n=1 Tax=Actinophytocola sp. TaxID=1872138 RepID=UPI003D6AE1A3